MLYDIGLPQSGLPQAILMTLSRQHKLIIISLVFYWTVLFILAHMPIPQLVRKADVSDKTLHFLAYMILSVLLFSAINPYKKVNWRKATVWWVILVIVLYGVVDELLQGYVAGRSIDAMDFVADLAGTLTGAILLSIFAFWTVCLVVTGVTIFGLSNIARANLADLLPRADTAFHLFAYALFTLLWIRYLYYWLGLTALKPKWLVAATMPPIGLLLAVKLGSLILGRSFTISEIIISVVGIVAAVGIIFVFCLCKSQISRCKTQN